jgi:hypothetical protein
VKHEALEQTARYWVGQDKQGRNMWKRIGEGLSLTRGRGQDGRIREVLQESSRSSMHKVYNIVTVLDLVSQVRNVVLMNVYLGLGNSGGSGFWNKGYEVDGSCHNKEGSK